MGRSKKFLIVVVLLLVFVVGVTFSQIDPGNPADGSIHIGEPTHVDRFNLSDQGDQGSRGQVGQNDLIGQGNGGSPGGQSDPDNSGAPGNPVNTKNPAGSDNPIVPGNPGGPDNPADPGNPGDPVNPGDPGTPADPTNQTEQNNDPSIPIPTPEFPSACIPALYLIGMVGAVLLIKRIKE